jgi:hypothetical protein
LNFKNYTELEQIHFCGNIDEPTLNPDILPILHHISEQISDKTKIFISTNGGTQNELFWKALAQIPKVITVFGIDGLENTNHIYRKNVKWAKVLSNVKTYIKHGGKGAWQFIVFEHNEHQVDEAEKYSQELGFSYFIEVNSRRSNHEVTEISVPSRNSKSCIQCKATYDNQDLGIGFFIDVRGNVWPCCWMATTEMANAIAEDIIGPKHGYYLDHNLHYETLEDIISGDFFAELYEKQDSIDICNEKCKDEMVDEFNWNI